MMKAQVQFAPWDKSYSFSFDDLPVSVGNFVVVETEMGMELGKVLSISEISEKIDETRELKPVLRLATYDDVSSLMDYKQKKETLDFCQAKIDFYKLPMKLVDLHVSFQGGRLNFAFVSDGRVDFRELVKDLAAHFGVNIRLTQIGTRDEAKITGDCGPCGRPLCCRGFLNEFSSITSEMAEAQQVVHRGSERISGMCGRLMCCLSYEYEGYKDLVGKLPPIGAKVNVDGVKGVVIGHHILKQTVDVKIPADKPGEKDVIIEVDINRHHKKNKEK